MSENSHHPPPHLHLLLRLPQVSVTHHGTLGCCHRNIPQKKPHQESPFPPSPKGEGRKSVQGFKRSWAMVAAAPTRPIPKIPSESWASLLCGEQRGCQTNTGNSSHEKQSKATGEEDFYIRQTSPSHLQGAQGAATGINPGARDVQMGLVSCHPAAISSCCYFLQTGTANPPL